MKECTVKCDIIVERNLVGETDSDLFQQMMCAYA